MKLSSSAKLTWIGLASALLINMPYVAQANDGCTSLLPKAREIIQKISPDPRLEIFDIVATCKDAQLIISGDSSSALLISQLQEDIEKAFSNAKVAINYTPEGSDFNGENWGLVTSPVATFNSKPKFASPIVSQAVLGTPIRLLKRSNPWVLAQTPDGYTGWIHIDQFKPLDESRLGIWNASQLLITRASGTAFTTPEGEPAGLLPAGSIVKGLEINSGKWLVQLPSGKKGYVPVNTVDYLSTWLKDQKESLRDDPEKFRENLVDTARGLIGTSYLWGGASSFGVDCSGLISAIFRANGLIISRDSDMQASLPGEVLEMRKLEPGDLVFFGKRTADGTHISHVGIYAGKSQFIHSLGEVKKGSFDEKADNYDAYEKSRFLFGLRLPKQITIAHCIEWLNDSPFYSPTPHEVEPCRFENRP